MKNYLKIFGVPGFLTGSLIALSNYRERPLYHYDMRVNTRKRLDRFYRIISWTKGLGYGIIFPYTSIRYIISLFSENHDWQRKLITPLSNSTVIIDEANNEYRLRRYISSVNSEFYLAYYQPPQSVSNNKGNLLEKYLFDFDLIDDKIHFYLYQSSEN